MAFVEAVAAELASMDAKLSLITIINRSTKSIML